jgi:hypothetical protein
MTIIGIIYDEPICSPHIFSYHIRCQVAYTGRYEITRRKRIVATIAVIEVGLGYQGIARSERIVATV